MFEIFITVDTFLIGKYKNYLLKLWILTKFKLIFNTWNKVRNKETLNAEVPPLKSALKFSELNLNLYFHLGAIKESERGVTETLFEICL